VVYLNGSLIGSVLDEYQAWNRRHAHLTIFLIVVVGENRDFVASTAIVLYKAFSGGEEGHGAMTLYRNSIVTRT
jgi:hypothetical protein